MQCSHFIPSDQPPSAWRYSAPALTLPLTHLTQSPFQTRPSSWRYSVPALMLPGESWNPEDYDVQSVISYDGEQQTKE